jgi:hypothetical protein
MGKDPKSGRIHPANIVVWWPYHFGMQVKLFVQRRVLNGGPAGEPLYNKVTPNL